MPVHEGRIDKGRYCALVGDAKEWGLLQKLGASCSGLLPAIKLRKQSIIPSSVLDHFGASRKASFRVDRASSSLHDMR